MPELGVGVKVQYGSAAVHFGFVAENDFVEYSGRWCVKPAGRVFRGHFDVGFQSLGHFEPEAEPAQRHYADEGGQGAPTRQPARRRSEDFLHFFAAEFYVVGF